MAEGTQEISRNQGSELSNATIVPQGDVAVDMTHSEDKLILRHPIYKLVGQMRRCAHLPQTQHRNKPRCTKRMRGLMGSLCLDKLGQKGGRHICTLVTPSPLAWRSPFQCIPCPTPVRQHHPVSGDGWTTAGPASGNARKRHEAQIGSGSCTFTFLG
jgi:hypothetical protein